MDLYEFLRQFVAYDIPSIIIVAGLVGGASYGIIQAMDAIAKERPPGGVGLNPNIKFYGALVLCAVIPILAWYLVTTNDQRPLTWGGVILAFAVSVVAAKGIHWVTGGAAKAMVSHRLEKVAAANRRFDNATGGNVDGS